MTIDRASQSGCHADWMQVVDRARVLQGSLAGGSGKGAPLLYDNYGGLWDNLALLHFASSFFFN